MPVGYSSDQLDIGGIFWLFHGLESPVAIAGITGPK